MFAFLLPQHLDHPPSNPFVVFIVHQSTIVLEEVQGRLADLKILFHILEGSGLYHRELVHDFKSCCSTHQILRVDISTCLDEQLHHLLMSVQRRFVQRCASELLVLPVLGMLLALFLKRSDYVLEQNYHMHEGQGAHEIRGLDIGLFLYQCHDHGSVAPLCS